MEIEIISMWYNEEFLAPLFLRHYDYADKITVLFDRDTNDQSLGILKADPKVTVIPFRFPDGMDDTLKQLKINEQYQASTADWVILVDADEFVFAKTENGLITDLRSLLNDTDADVFMVAGIDVMRHQDDQDIDRGLPPLLQRRHAPPGGQRKPCLARGGLKVLWKVGCHQLIQQQELNFVEDAPLYFSHWAMADPGFCIERRLKNRKARQSQNNLKTGQTFHNHHVTLKDLKAEFAEGLTAPQRF